jgi:hypothetical protein
MIASVINDPREKQTVILLIIEPENLERMSKGDPATLESVAMGGVLPNVEYPENYGVIVAYETDSLELYKKTRGGDLGELLRYLNRGRRFIQGVDGTGNAFKIPRPGSPGEPGGGAK